jgi:hypothetical protein
MSDLKVCITIDTDADPLIKNHKTSVSFKNLDYSLNKISDKFTELENKLNITLPISWFVRVDNQIKDELGSYDWILNNYSKFWENERSKKNEIHWHSHIYEMINDKWVFPKNKSFYLNEIEKIFNFLKKNHFEPECIRMGEAYMNNDIMNLLKNLGLKADSSCIPGRQRKDKEKFFDWSTAKNFPYFPSNKNYQEEDKIKKIFLEIPMNTIQTKCEYDKKPLLRYMNLAFKSHITYNGLEKFIKDNDLLVTISHPYEFFDKFENNKVLLSNDLNTLEENINNIFKLSKQFKKNIRFVKISEIINDYLNEK